MHHQEVRKQDDRAHPERAREVEVGQDGVRVEHAVGVGAREEEAQLVALRVGAVGERAEQERDLGGGQPGRAGEVRAAKLDC